MKYFNLEMKSSYTPWFLISYLLASVGANKEENCNCMGLQSAINNANIANFVWLWKTRIHHVNGLKFGMIVTHLLIFFLQT